MNKKDNPKWKQTLVTSDLTRFKNLFAKAEGAAVEAALKEGIEVGFDALWYAYSIKTGVLLVEATTSQKDFDDAVDCFSNNLKTNYSQLVKSIEGAGVGG